MKEQLNPYEAPQSNLEILPKENGDPLKMYSTKQAAFAAFLGGPLAGAYAIRRNFQLLGNSAYASKTMMIAIPLTLAMIGAIPFLPDHLPSTTLPVLWGMITMHIMNKYMPSKEELSNPREYQFRSNWSVVLVVIAALSVTIAIAIPWLMLQ